MTEATKEVLWLVLKAVGVLLALPAAYFLFMLLYGIGAWLYFAWDRRRRDRWRAQVDAFWFGLEFGHLIGRVGALFRARDEALRQRAEFLQAREEIARASYWDGTLPEGVTSTGPKVTLRYLSKDELPEHLRAKVERLERGEDLGELAWEDGAADEAD